MAGDRGGTQQVPGAHPLLPLPLAQGLLHRSLPSWRENMVGSPFQHAPKLGSQYPRHPHPIPSPLVVSCLPCQIGAEPQVSLST